MMITLQIVLCTLQVQGCYDIIGTFSILFPHLKFCGYEVVGFHGCSDFWPSTFPHEGGASNYVQPCHCCEARGRDGVSSPRSKNISALQACGSSRREGECTVFLHLFAISFSVWFVCRSSSTYLQSRGTILEVWKSTKPPHHHNLSPAFINWRVVIICTVYWRMADGKASAQSVGKVVEMIDKIMGKELDIPKSQPESEGFITPPTADMKEAGFGVGLVEPQERQTECAGFQLMNVSCAKTDWASLYTNYTIYSLAMSCWCCTWSDWARHQWNQSQSPLPLQPHRIHDCWAVQQSMFPQRAEERQESKASRCLHCIPIFMI